MALIKCPECGKEISDKASACIHCGYPFDNIHKICKVNNSEFDLTELETLFHTLSDEEQMEFRREISIKYKDPSKYEFSNTIERKDIYDKVTAKIVHLVCEHFNWWNDGSGKNHPAYKFIMECLDHNFQYFEFNTSDSPNPNVVRCPKCGSTSITTQERGFDIMWGFLGASKKKNLCQKCGYKWWPGSK